MIILLNEYKLNNEIYWIIKKNFFVCKSHTIYIPIISVCDGRKDCPEADDEFECFSTNNLFFKCNNTDNKFIFAHFVCDQVIDCKNGGLDEKFCRKFNFCFLNKD